MEESFTALHLQILSELESLDFSDSDEVHRVLELRFEELLHIDTASRKNGAHYYATLTDEQRAIAEANAELLSKMQQYRSYIEACEVASSSSVTVPVRKQKHT